MTSLSGPFEDLPLLPVLGETALHFLWQGLVIAGLYGLCARPARARTRYVLGCVALATMVLAVGSTFLVIASGAAPGGAGAALAPQALERSWVQRLDVALPWLGGAWALGAVFLQSRLLYQYLCVQRVRRRGTRPVSSAVQAMVVDVGSTLR